MFFGRLSAFAFVWWWTLHSRQSEVLRLAVYSPGGGMENMLRNTLIFTATEQSGCWRSLPVDAAVKPVDEAPVLFWFMSRDKDVKKRKKKKELPTWYVQRCFVPLQWSNKSSQCHSSCLFGVFFIISYADNFTVSLLETAGRYWIKLNPTIPHCQKIIGFLTHLNSLSHPECAEVHMRAQAPPTHGVISSFCPRDLFFTAWAHVREGKGELSRAKGKTKLPPPSK